MLGRLLLAVGMPPLRCPPATLSAAPELPGEVILEQTSIGPYEKLQCRSSTPSKCSVVLVPGNPGMSGFYAGFADKLATRMDADVAVVGLAGHVALPTLTQVYVPPNELRSLFNSFDTDGSGRISVSELQGAAESMGRPLSMRQARRVLQRADLDSSGDIDYDEFVVALLRPRGRIGRLRRLIEARWRSLHSLDAQVAHLREAIMPYAKRASESGTPLVLIGHSIGAWMLTRLIADLCSAGTRGVTPAPTLLLLMPFLENNLGDQSFRAKHTALTRLPWLIPLLAILAAPLRLAPDRWRRRILDSQVGGMEPEYVALVERGMLHRGAVHNYLHLARTEMFALSRRFDTASLSSLIDAGRVRALYIEAGDEWAPLTLERRLAADGVLTSVLSEGEARHAFSCNASDTRRVADWVVEQLSDIV